jgi:hypothetical protein
MLYMEHRSSHRDVPGVQGCFFLGPRLRTRQYCYLTASPLSQYCANGCLH